MEPLIVILAGLALWTACMAVLFAVLWLALTAEPDLGELMPLGEDAIEREASRAAVEAEIEEAEIELRAEAEEKRLAHLWN